MFVACILNINSLLLLASSTPKYIAWPDWFCFSFIKKPPDPPGTNNSKAFTGKGVATPFASSTSTDVKE